MPGLMQARTKSREACFAAGIRQAADAFRFYLLDNNIYPPDRTPAQMPPGMESYLKNFPWDEPTPVGGKWDWDNGQFGFTAGVSVYRPAWDDTEMARVDRLLDDGDLGAGIFRKRSDGYIYIIEH